jgi:hypothetical protein
MAGGVLCLAGVYLARRPNRTTRRASIFLADPAGSAQIRS